jgi:hypothetical protein
MSVGAPSARARQIALQTGNPAALYAMPLPAYDVAGVYFSPRIQWLKLALGIH